MSFISMDLSRIAAGITARDAPISRLSIDSSHLKVYEERAKCERISQYRQFCN
ncbi:hypothetical protein G3485_19405 [Shewanella baltica]|uniref:hypothetical protein n=1 Tax=Shewanella baltica TaxID=62322 RepID=UPI00217F00A6|nr:hypothetical protein [Shewanella baltica]MCS6129275.1 hypothetical protein [Shewanella baltica]MCS6141211.1 hypothetical protein [Shewanella baltica]MCS6147495.1 hypothetical protein [Shewanella baltica]MCS6172024.1 hypothetical protein [Shewanella baltica]MCS6189243.1 hypothetical protein [Shewanella baltica]